MMTGWLHGPLFRLNIVMLSSLAFLTYGFSPPSGVIEVLQLPVAAMQSYFILAVAWQSGLRGFVAPLSFVQRALALALIIYMIVIAAISPIPSANILVFSWIIHVLFFVALVTFFQTVERDEAGKIWLILGIVALLHVAAFLIAWLGWPEQIKPKTLVAFGHVRHLGYLVAPAAAVMAVHFIARNDAPLISLACFSAAALYLFFTGSRGGAIALLGGVAAAGIYLAWHRQAINSQRSLVLLGVTGLIMATAQSLPALPWGTILDRGGAAVNQTGLEMLAGRDQVWRFIVDAISANWLLGYGPALMNEIPGYDGPEFYHPHSIVLQLLVHWGVAGTSIILAFLVSFAPNVWQALRRRPGLSALPVTILSTMAIHSLIDGNLFYPFSLVIAFIAFSMLEVTGRQCRTQSSLDKETVSSSL